MSKQKTDKINKIVSGISIGLLAVYFGACIFLYYMQATHPGEGLYQSDLPLHISMAMDGWGYSLTAILYRILMFLPFGEAGIAVLLAVATVGCVAATYMMLRRYDIPAWQNCLITFASSMAMACFVESIHYQRYIGYQAPSIWHNSTYIVMKVFAIVSLALYLSISKEYANNLSASKSVLFAVLLAVTTSVKTSFAFAFAPAALVFLLVDLLNKTPVKRVLLAALTVVPTLAVIIFQEAVLFGENTGNSIEIEFGYTLYLRAANPALTMILSALFPVIVFLFNIIPVLKDTFADFKQRKALFRHKDFLFSWTMWLVGALELIFLKETGTREKDGNFSWGYDFCLFVLFIISGVYFVRNIRDDKFLWGNKILKAIYIAIAGGSLVYHVYCGLYFFVNLMLGKTFFM